MRNFVAALLALSVAPTIAIAQPAPRSGTQTMGSMPTGSATGGVNENGERLICRRIAASESRLAARRVCKTAAEWSDYNRSIDNR